VGEYGWASLSRKHYPRVGDIDGVKVEDVLDLAGGVTHSGTATSRGVDDGAPAVLSYEPRGSALDRVPPDPYETEDVYFDYSLRDGAADDFLPIFLARLAGHLGQPAFADEFRDEFEAYLRSVDTDEEAPGLQPHLDPEGNPVLALEDVHWFGPENTWPKELVNYAWIEFWHHLDQALADRGFPGLGTVLVGDGIWGALFDGGKLAENGDITMRRVRTTPTVRRIGEDQSGAARPDSAASDIGAVELP
jgi:hypothetical protein